MIKKVSNQEIAKAMLFFSFFVVIIFAVDVSAVEDVVLNSTYGTNYSNENLTAYLIGFPSYWTNFHYDWYVDGDLFLISNFTEKDKIQSSDLEVGDEFGFSVSIFGDYAISGAYKENNTGAAYVFVKNASGEFEEVNKIVSSDIGASDYFGYSVDIFGEYAIVGAPVESSGGAGAGAAYVFVKNASGEFEEVNKIVSSDIAAGDYFGIDVSISGNYAIVGAYREGSGGVNAGAAYVFVKNASGEFEEVNKLVSSDIAAGDLFGVSVSIFGDYAIVGAANEGTGGVDAGAAYVFVKNASGEFEEVNKIVSSDIAAGDKFGGFVDIFGDYAIVGAANEGTGGVDAGAAYVFVKNASGEFEEVNKIQASDVEAGDLFGTSVSIFGDYAIVGSKFEGDGGAGAGAAYVFVKNASGEFEEVNKIKSSDMEAGDFFGRSVSIFGDHVIVGAYKESDAGAAYIFTPNETIENVLNSAYTSINETWYVNVIPYNSTNVSLVGYASNNLTILNIQKISLVSPANGTSTTSTNIVFKFNLTDVSLNNCSLIINNIAVQNRSGLSPGVNRFTHTLAVGSYLWNVSCTNYFGSTNVSNETRSLTINSPTPSSGGGSNSLSNTVFTIKRIQMVKDVQEFVLRVSEKVDFEINNQKHSLTLTSINQDSIYVTVESEPQRFEIKTGEKIDVDVNGDGISDLRIFVKDISKTRLVTLSLEKFNKQNIVHSESTQSKIPELVEDSEVKDQEPKEEAIKQQTQTNKVNKLKQSPQNNKFIYGIFFVLLIIIIIVFITLKMKTKKQHRSK